MKFSLTTGDPLTLDIEFEVDQPVEKTHWEVHNSCPEAVQAAHFRLRVLQSQCLGRRCHTWWT